MKTSIFCPFDRTGNVETFSGGAKLPRIKGPRIGGNGHQSPTTSPVYGHKYSFNHNLLMLHAPFFFNITCYTKHSTASRLQYYHIIYTVSYSPVARLKALL